MSLSKKYFMVIYLSLFGFTEGVVAAPAESVGQVTIDLSGKKPKPKEIREAKTLASVKALESYIQADQPKMRLYSRCLKSGMADRINDFITMSNVVREDVDKSARQLTMALKISVNTAHLDNVLESECKGNTSQKARISFVFFAREKLPGGGFKVPEGNIHIDAKVKQVFLNNTFKPVSNNRLERADRRYKKSVMQEQYVKTGDIDWLIVEDAVIRYGSDYFAFGAFEIREPAIDKATGLPSSSVVVSAELIDIGDESSLGVAGPVQVRALGATSDEAATNALKLASEKLANAIVSQLNAQKKH